MDSDSIIRRFESCQPSFFIAGCSVVWLARLIWDQEVAGSNPVTPSLKDLNLLWWVWRSWLARQIVALEAVGSNPTIHP